MDYNYTGVTSEFAERAIGALIGQAVGDALGAPYEFRQAGLFMIDNPDQVSYRPTLGAFGWEAGEFTDDTQMAYLLGEILLRRELDRDMIFGAWKEWAKTAADVGVTTRMSLNCGNFREVKKRLPQGNGNGAVMRVSPVGIMGFRKGSLWNEWASREQALLTHTDPRTVESAVIAAVVIGRLIQNPTHSLGELVHYAITNHVYPWSERPRMLSLLLDGNKNINHTNPPNARNGEGHICLLQALQAVDLSSDFVSAVSHAINRGDDADTVGAVAGAIAGAKYSYRHIPRPLIDNVHGHVPDRVNHVDLAHMAIRLAGGKIVEKTNNRKGSMLYNS